ncbi:hypothetical protein [Microbacterium sp. CGR1]|uniref:hypothetical protein n=1 Tax=Microbacterium sp. CGR1 TaxID=1696072 RepID=UPI003DA4BD6A
MSRLTIKRKWGGIAAALAVTASMLILPAQAASACTISLTHTASSANVSVQNDCIGSIEKVQVRLYRYYNSVINTFYGAEGTWSSTVTNGTGTQAGQAYRQKSAISHSWSGYISYTS